MEDWTWTMGANQPSLVVRLSDRGAALDLTGDGTAVEFIATQVRSRVGFSAALQILDNGDDANQGLVRWLEPEFPAAGLWACRFKVTRTGDLVGYAPQTRDWMVYVRPDPEG